MAGLHAHRRCAFNRYRELSSGSRPAVPTDRALAGALVRDLTTATGETRRRGLIDTEWKRHGRFREGCSVAADTHYQVMLSAPAGLNVLTSF